MRDSFVLKQRIGKKIFITLIMAIVGSFFGYIIFAYFPQIRTSLAAFGVSISLMAVSIYVIIRLWINKRESLKIEAQGISLQRVNYERNIKAVDIKKIVYFESEERTEEKWLLVCLKSSLIIPVKVTFFSYKTEELVESIKCILQQKHGIEVMCTNQQRQIDALFAASCVKPDGPAYELKNSVIHEIVSLIIIMPFLIGFSEVFYNKIGNWTYSILITIFLGLISTGVVIATIVTKIKEGEIHLTMNGNGYLTHNFNIKWDDVKYLLIASGGKYTDIFLQKTDGEEVWLMDVPSPDLEEQVSYFAQRLVPLMPKKGDTSNNI